MDITSSIAQILLILQLALLCVAGPVRESGTPIEQQSRRVKRAPRPPMPGALEGFANSGTVVYVARKFCTIRFEVDPQRFSSSDIVLAELHLYKTRPKSLKFLKKADAKQTRKARVSVHQVIKAGKYMSETKKLERRRVHVKASGWQKFDITKAMKEWSQDAKTNKGLEIWVESTEPGEFAARVARKFSFVKADDKKIAYRPSLVIVFKDQDTNSTN